MQAMTYHGPKRVRVENKPEPRIEHPNDVILRVTRAAICGSDIHLYEGLIPDTRVGHTFGHEFTGVVEELGPSVQTLKRGDRVVVPFNISCGTCYFCKRGLTANCENTNPNADLACGVYGYSHTTGGYDGGQAEYVRVPFADVGPMKIPDDMDDEDVLFLSDILPTAYQGAEMGEIVDGDTVVVYGAGPVGILTARCAWLMGAGRVIMVDHVDYRLAFARRYAQVETINYRQVDDIVLHIKKMTDGRGADVCIDAVGCDASGSHMHTVLGKILKLEGGAPTAIEWCINTARKGGKISLIGVYGPPWNMIPIGTAMNKGLTLRMNQCNVKRYMPHLLEHIRAGRIDAKGIISHRLSIEEIPYGYEIFTKKQDECIKCVIVPPRAA
ncbi:zinc-dependent alcohol dehydrogenase [Polyangium mundeleinium]|uniref:Glutathione-dependent formaldehyde dehydrogenase n=1 Tax=Polyangium mundeleinium TaxID=2995306 RepID=A0ABT5EUH9_9BACT|nr:glutathione-dependent formaldehyde dehydrogenase [Polyangium mundeleinium]